MFNEFEYNPNQSQDYSQLSKDRAQHKSWCQQVEVVWLQGQWPQDCVIPPCVLQGKLDFCEYEQLWAYQALNEHLDTKDLQFSGKGDSCSLTLSWNDN